TAAARPNLVKTQAVRRGWRLCARGRLEPATHLPHITARIDGPVGNSFEDGTTWGFAVAGGSRFELATPQPPAQTW
ncbi:MAG: hypothetical protein FWD80_06345, partial [Propionibacteriaceae bacterium]|nr:hypothetical protein [Propionibacteriaceae bacterium]